MIYNLLRSIQQLRNRRKNRLFRMSTVAITLALWLIPAVHTVAQKYNKGDIAVINAIIDVNKLSWTPVAPVDGTYVDTSWSGVIWSEEETNRRIVTLFVDDKSLEGTLDVSGLTSLEWLSCNDNALTAINVSGLVNLVYLNCAGNRLESLEVSELENLKTLMCNNNKLKWLKANDCTNLESLYCQNNILTSLKLSELENLEHLNCSYNSLTLLELNTSASYEYINISYNNAAYMLLSTEKK